MRISKTGTPDPVIVGNKIVYTIVATNDGPATARDVRVQELLPPELVDATISPAAHCTLPAGGCTFGDLQPGESREIRVEATVGPTAGATLVNTATVESDTDDQDPTNNDDDETTSVLRSADVRIVKSVEPSPLVPGRAGDLRAARRQRRPVAGGGA